MTAREHGLVSMELCSRRVELALNHRHSPLLKLTSNPTCAHNLKALLYLVDGYHGKGQEFRLGTGRDIALANKNCDFLKPKHSLLPCSRQDKHKGMVRGQDGRWVMPERPRMDPHPPDMAHYLEQVLKVAGLPLDSI